MQSISQDTPLYDLRNNKLNIELRVAKNHKNKSHFLKIVLIPYIILF